VALSALDLGAAEDAGLPRRGPLPRRSLAVQPVLTYEVPQRREATSWRSWGGIQTEADAEQEKARIARELAEMARGADFPLDIRPVQAVKSVEPAARLAAGDHDVMMIFGAGGWLNILEALSAKDKWSLMFLRHDPGPAYLWYEIAHPRFLRKTVDEYGQPGWDVNDVVVDRYADACGACARWADSRRRWARGSSASAARRAGAGAERRRPPAPASSGRWSSSSTATTASAPGSTRP
jgi:hypothetical protein